MNIAQFTPIGTKIAVELSQSISRGQIMVASSYVEATSTCRIVKVGSKVSNLKPNDIILIPSSFTGKKSNKFGNIVICESKEAFAKVIKKKIYPIGNRLLVKRFVDEEELESGIIIPACTKSKDQGLDCEIIQPGILQAGQRWKMSGYQVGQKVRLNKWSESMIEILYQGSYHLIVAESDLLCTL